MKPQTVLIRVDAKAEVPENNHQYPIEYHIPPYGTPSFTFAKYSEGCWLKTWGEPFLEEEQVLWWFRPVENRYVMTENELQLISETCSCYTAGEIVIMFMRRDRKPRMPGDIFLEVYGHIIKGISSGAPMKTFLTGVLDEQHERIESLKNNQL